MNLFGSNNNPALIDSRLRSIERKLDIIMNSLGLAVEPEDMELMKDLVRQGRKIEAIKMYREKNGSGLAEAKDAIDRLS